MADTRPGTCRSNVGCEAIEEPCTKRMVPSGAGDVRAAFSHRKSRTDPFVVQCSRPATAGSATIFLGSVARARACLAMGSFFANALRSRVVHNDYPALKV